MSFATRLLDNPILKREFTSAARNHKTILLATVASLTLAFILYFLWPRTGIFSDANSNELFTIFLGAELTFLLLMTAGFTASSITFERERNTFPMLQTSLLAPWEIFFGKLVGSLGISLVLFLVTVPIASLCALSGGISIPTLLKALSVAGVSTIVFGLMGLAISSLCRRTYVSLLLTYIAVAVVAGATWLPYALFDIPSLKPWFIRLRALSPYEALFALQFTEAYEIDVVGAKASSTFLWFSIGMAVLGILSFIIFACFIFAPPNFKRTQTVTQYTDTKTMLKRKLGWPFYLIDPLRRKKPIPSWRNCVFIAEIRSKIFGNPKFIIRALAVCICISLGLLVAILGQIGETEIDRIRAVAIIFQLGLISLLAPTVSSGSVTDELSNNTFLLLRLSPLTSFTVVLGKIKAALLYVTIFLLSSLPVLIVLVFLETNESPDFAAMIPHGLSLDALSAAGEAIRHGCQIYSRVFSWVAVLTVTCLLLTSAGLCASCFSPTTGVATAASYGFALLVVAGSLAILLFGARTSPTMQACFLMFNPFVAALEITLDHSLATNLPPIFGQRLWINHLIISCALTVILIIVSAWRVRYLFREQK